MSFAPATVATAAEMLVWASHDLCEARAKHRILLAQLDQLLSDATDALAIDPPAPDVAARRIANVRRKIAEAL